MPTLELVRQTLGPYNDDNGAPLRGVREMLTTVEEAVQNISRLTSDSAWDSGGALPGSGNPAGGHCREDERLPPGPISKSDDHPRTVDGLLNHRRRGAQTPVPDERSSGRHDGTQRELGKTNRESDCL